MDEPVMQPVTTDLATIVRDVLQLDDDVVDGDEAAEPAVSAPRASLEELHSLAGLLAKQLQPYLHEWTDGAKHRVVALNDMMSTIFAQSFAVKKSTYITSYFTKKRKHDDAIASSSSSSAANSSPSSAASASSPNDDVGVDFWSDSESSSAFDEFDARAMAESEMPSFVASKKSRFQNVSDDDLSSSSSSSQSQSPL